jgi:predicted Ser/Thr protein kinase
MVDRDEIKLEKKIGEGAQGQVFTADWRGMVVVVKLVEILKSQGSCETYHMN